MNKNPMLLAMSASRKRAEAYVAREETAIATRAQMVWAVAMLQAGLSPKTVQKIRKIANEAVATKFIEYRQDGVAEQWCIDQLKDAGIEFKAIPPKVSFDY